MMRHLDQVDLTVKNLTLKNPDWNQQRWGFSVLRVPIGSVMFEQCWQIQVQSIHKAIEKEK